MARLRTIVGLLAIGFVLLHAGLIVRHNVSMLGGKLQQLTLAADLAVICHGAGANGQLPAADIPDLPAPADDQGDCPICKGMASATAILTAPDFDLRRPDRATARMVVIGKVIAVRLARLQPPATGPPHTA